MTVTLFAEHFEPVKDEHERLELQVEGEIPGTLRGIYVRNGPNPEFPCFPYSMFDGDGMLHAVSIEDKGAYYTNKWVLTAGLQEERKAGKSRQSRKRSG